LGEKLLLVPSHCDPTFNLHDSVVTMRGGKVEAVWPVSARGLSR
jgi:D-serine deaminase-like pyridoxal phosphate-dependent protein